MRFDCTSSIAEASWPPAAETARGGLKPIGTLRHETALVGVLSGGMGFGASLS